MSPPEVGGPAGGSGDGLEGEAPGRAFISPPVMHSESLSRSAGVSFPTLVSGEPLRPGPSRSHLEELSALSAQDGHRQPLVTNVTCRRWRPGGVGGFFARNSPASHHPAGHEHEHQLHQLGPELLGGLEAGREVGEHQSHHIGHEEPNPAPGGELGEAHELGDGPGGELLEVVGGRCIPPVATNVRRPESGVVVAATPPERTRPPPP